MNRAAADGAKVARAGALVIPLVMFLPLAAASDAGSLASQGAFSFQAESTTRFHPIVALLNDTTRLDGITLSAPRVLVRHFQMTTLTLTPTVGAVIHDTGETYTLHNVTMRLSSVQEGYLSLLGALEGTARLDSAALRAAPWPPGEISHGTSVGEPRDDEPTFAFHVDRPHLRGHGPGTLAYDGAGRIKLLGPDLWVESDERQGFLPSGRQEGSPAPGGRSVLRWVVLEFEDARIVMDARSPWLAAFDNATTSWDGVATMKPVSGALEGAGARHVPTPDVARIDGRLDAHIRPILTRSGDLLTWWDVSGTLRTTTLHAQALHAAPTPSGNLVAIAWPVFGAVLALGATGGYTLAGRRRRARMDAREMDAEDYAETATAAASLKDWPEAVEWFTRARRLAPTSARLCADLAFALSQVGDHDEALRLYEEASRLSGDGEADLNGAITALGAGRPPDEVERWLARALERSPLLALDLDGDETFAPLRGRTAYEEAMERAWERLGGDGFGVA